MNVSSPKNNPPKLKDFYGHDFIITRDVLIPRPETELMIDAVLNLAGQSYLPGVKPAARKLPPNPIILDVGTGSGCIAISIKLALPEATVYATDISQKALAVATKNAALHDTPITTIISHLLENVKFTPDIIVANLPYVDESWPWLDKKALSREPSSALYAEDGGLALIKELILQAAARETTYLLLEADPCQHASVTDFATSAHYQLIETRGFILVFKYQKIDRSPASVY